MTTFETILLITFIAFIASLSATIVLLIKYMTLKGELNRRHISLKGAMEEVEPILEDEEE